MRKGRSKSRKGHASYLLFDPGFERWRRRMQKRLQFFRKGGRVVLEVVVECLGHHFAQRRIVFPEESAHILVAFVIIDDEQKKPVGSLRFVLEGEDRGGAKPAECLVGEVLFALQFREKLFGVTKTLSIF